MLDAGDQPVKELRNTIQMKLNQLQERVTDEAREVRDFSVKQPIRQDTTAAIAKEARSLKPDYEESRDEAERAQRSLDGIRQAPPPVDYRPVYYRLGALGGLLITLSFLK